MKTGKKNRFFTHHVDIHKKPKNEFSGEVLDLVRSLKSHVEWEGLLGEGCFRE